MSLNTFVRRLMTRPVNARKAAPIRNQFGRGLEALEDRVTPVAGDYNFAFRAGSTAIDYSRDIAVSNGFIYVTGEFNGTVDFDPGAGTVNLVSNGLSDAFVAKYTDSGALVWAKNLGGTNPDAGNGITVDAAGNVYTTGYFTSSGDFDPGPSNVGLNSSAGATEVYVSKLDANGNYVGAWALGGNKDDYGVAIAVDAAGNMYTTGKFANKADFDPAAGAVNLDTGNNLYDAFVSKLDATGLFVYAKQFGGATDDEGLGLRVDGSGNVYVAGGFTGTTTAGFTLTSAGSSDAFVAKLDSTGTASFAKRLGGTGADVARRLTIDAGGAVYTVGNYSGTADFDPGAGTVNLVSAGATDVFVSKLDSSGNFALAKSFGGTGADLGGGIALDGDGNIYTTGSFVGTADFDPGAGVVNLTSAGGTDVFVSKLTATGALGYARGAGGTTADDGFGIATDSIGAAYVTGQFTGTADFDPGVAVANQTSLGLTDAFVLKLDGTPNGTLTATLSSGNLTILDIAPTGKNNAISASVSGTDLVITDANEQFVAAPPGGILSNGNKTLTLPLASVTGNLTFNLLGGNDTLTLNLATGDVIPAGNLVFNGGTPTTGPGDSLVITGGSQGTVTYNYTNASDGDVVMANFGTVTYAGLEPITNTGTATDVIFNLPASASAATLADDGTGGNGMSRFSGATFERTDFSNPTNSLTINRGTTTDTLTANALPDFTAGLTIGAAGAEFSAVTFAGAINLGANNLTAFATRIGVTAGITAGNITLDADTGSQVAGDFDGVTINGASVLGSGLVTIEGRGGNSAAGGQVGVLMLNNAVVRGGAGPGTTVDIRGLGGAAVSALNTGFEMFGGTTTTVTSLGGNVFVQGTGGGTGAVNDQSGVSLVSTGNRITADGTGTVTVVANSGNVPQNAIGLATNPGTVIDSAGGSVTVTATAKSTAAGGGTTAVYHAGLISAGGPGTVSVSGTVTAGVNSTIGVLLRLGGDITSTNGAIAVTGATPSGGVGVRLETNASASTIAAGTNNAVTITSDSLDIQSNTSITSGTGTTTIRQRTNGTVLDLGGADVPTGGPLTLGLTDGELDNVTAGTLQIGDANSGTITVTAAITRTAATVVNLTSGGSVNFTTGSLNTGGGNATLTPGTGSVGVANSGVDVTVGASSTLAFASGADLAVAITGTAVDTQYHQLNVAGLVNLTGVDLVLSGAYVPTAADVFILVANDGTDAIAGTFNGLPEGATVTVNGVPKRITYVGGTGNDVALVAPATLTAVLSSGTLTITDVGAGGRDNTITAVVVGANLVITDANEQFQSAPPGGTLSNGDKTLTIPLALLTGALAFDLAAGADALTLDYSGGALPGTISYDAGAGADTFTLTGGTTTGVRHTFANPTDGSVTLTGAIAGVITYLSLTPITDNLTAADRVFNATGAGETIALADTGGADGKMTVTSTLGATVAFTNPSASLTVDTVTGATAGADTVNISGVDAAYRASTVINTDGGDTVGVTAALTLGSATSAGHFTIADASAVTLSANISTDAGTNAGSITVTGPVTFGADVTLDTDAAGTDGNITFNNPLNATAADAQSLTLAAGGGSITLVSVGATTRPLAVTISSANNVTGTQVTAGSGGIAQTAGTGTTTFTGPLQSVGGGSISLTAGTLTLADLTVSGAGAIGLTHTGANSLGVTGTTTLGATGVLTATATTAGTTGTISGPITGTGTAAVVKAGPGTLTLTAANTYPGTTTVSGGVLLVNGSVAGGAVTVAGGAVLGGSGSVGGTVGGAGTVAPGATFSPTSTATLTAGGADLTGGTFQVQINGLTAGTQYDRLTTTGGVTLGGAALALGGTFVPSGASIQTFVVVANGGAGAVSGTFAGLPEGSTVTLNGQTLYVTYHGGDGNDVALTSQPVVTGTNGPDTLVFTPISATSFSYQLNGGPVVTIAGGVFTFEGLGGDDYMELLVNGNALPPGGVFFNGGTEDFVSRAPNSVGDVLRITGTVAGQTATYTPDAATLGTGTVQVSGGGLVSFTGVEPAIDLTGLATATLLLPNAADVLSVANGTESAFGTAAALTVSGTSGGVGIVAANFFGNGTVVVNTATTDGNDAVTVAGGTNAHLNANVSIATGTGTDAVTVTGGLTVTGDVTVTSQNIAFNAGTISAGGTVTVNAGAGAITTSTTAGDVVAASVIATATTGVDLDTMVTNITATNTGAGNVTLDEADGATLPSVTTANGAVAVTSATGNLVATSVTANGTGHNILLSTAAGDIALGSVTASGDGIRVSAAGAITDANGAAVNLTASNLILTATTGVGSADAVETDADNLAASSTSGNIAIAEANGLTVASVAAIFGTPLAGVSATGGTVSIAAAGNLTVNAAASATGAAALAFAGTANLNAAVSGAPATVTGGGGNDVFNVTVVGTATDLTLQGAGGDDTYNVQLGGFSTTKILFLNDTAGTDKAYTLGAAAADTFNVNSTANPNRVEVGGNRVQYAGAGAGGLDYLDLAGGTGGDTYNVYFGGLVAPDTRVNAGTGADTANLFGTTGGDTFDVNDTLAQAVLASGEKVTYTAALEQLVVNGHRDPADNPLSPTATDGSDSFTVSPDAVTAITINGGTPVSPVAPGDYLFLNATGVVNPVLPPTPTPNGQVTSDNKATVTWRSIETFQTNAVVTGKGGSFDFETTPTQTQPGWQSVLPSNAGWVTAPLGFDRDGTYGYNPPPGVLSKLLRDGAWGFSGVANFRDFRVAVAAGTPFQVTAILGDTATVNDQVDVLLSSDGGATFTKLNPAANTFQNSADKGYKFVSHAAEYTPTSNTLTVRVVDNGGDPYWTITALDVRPLSLRAPITLARADAASPATPVSADGVTVDAYTGSGAAAGSLVTVAPSNGTLLGADADALIAGFQVLADGTGAFAFSLRRPTGEGPAVLTATAVGGESKGVVTQNYFLPGVRRIDFGPAGSPVAVGEPVTQPYVGVGAEAYTSRAANALGWVGAVTAFDRATGSALQRDFVYGTASDPRDFRFNMPAAGTYSVSVVLGDPGFARDGMFVSIVSTTTGLVTSTPVSGVSTPVGQSVSRTFTAVADANGEIRLRFGDNAGDLFWTVQALEVRPTQGVITIAGATSVPADGVALTTYTLSGATAGAIVTVTNTHGVVTTTDADPSFVGFQVIANGAGTATFEIKSPQATSDLTATLTADETTGARAVAPYTVTYTGTTGGGGGTTAYRFDFNGGGVVNTSGFVSVRGSDTFSTLAGYGWAATQNEFERTAASVSGKGVIASQVPLYQDGAWGYGSGVFQVAVTKNEANLAARIYVGDSYTNWPYISLSVEGGSGPLALNTTATPFGAYTLTGADANGDGKWDITISSGYVWVVNGIDVASGGAVNLPALPQTALPRRAATDGDVVTESALAPVVAAAIDRLTAAGNLTAALVAQLRDVRFAVGDLGNDHLGEHVGGLIRLDADANGQGWFVDPTPADDAEFTPVSATEGVGGRGVDLLTVVMHELSHELGETDVDAGFDPDGLMTESLGAGVRRLPNGGSWALSVGVQLPVAEEVEVVGPVAGSTVRPVAAVKEESVWADSPAVSGAVWSWSDTPALQPDWFADDLIGGVPVA